MTDKYHFWLIFIIPFALVFSIFIADLTVIVLSFLFVLVVIQKKQFKLFLNEYFIFFFIFWLYLIINSFFSYNVEVSLSRSIPYIRFGIFILALGYLINEKQIEKLIFSIFIFLLFICFDAIMQFFLGFNLFGYDRHPSRISSFFDKELVLGSFLLKMYPFFLIFLVMYKKKIVFVEIFYLVLISIYSFSIFISGERTAFFNFIVYNLIFLIIFYDKLNIKKISTFFLLFAMFIIISTIYDRNTFERYLIIKKLNTNSSFKIFSDMHENHYKTAYKIFQSHIIVGSGIKTFRHICKKNEFEPEGCATHPHNTFMQFLSELGLLGLVFYILAFFYFSIKIIKLFLMKINLKIYDDNFLIKTILTISILISLWPFSPSGNFFNNWLSILTYLPIGILIFFDRKA